jgi:23S rRNA (guanosine2251-2'-O)-methyltransferase
MKTIYILLDNVRSIYNVGSVFRTADGCGISKIILCGITATPEHPKLKKTSLGAEESVKYEYFKDSIEAVKHFKKEGFTIISVELTPSSVDFRSVNYSNNTVLIFGHEVTGVSTEILELSDSIIQIPMVGIKESLNVATTVGIIAYNAMNDSI